MPVALYHGPASLQKKNLFTQLVTKHSDSSVIVVPNASFISYYQQKLAKIAVMTWEDFSHQNISQDLQIFFIHFYPLSSDQLEVLAKLKIIKPKLSMHIFYDEHFDQENKTLQKVYTELGHLSDVSEYIEAEPQSSLTVFEFTNPFDEMYFVVDDIKKSAEMPTTILAPGEDYHGPLARLIHRQKLTAVTLLTDGAKWGTALNGKVYVLGLSLENFSQVLIEKARQLFALNSNIVITRSETDFQHKFATALKPGVLSTNSQKQITTTAEAFIPTHTRHHDYFKTKKKTFSISEIQEYLNCPYRYYARYHLNLKVSGTKDLEPDHDIKGSFVHRVLYRLVKENEAEYLEGLEYESYRQKLTQKLSQIIQEELNKDEKMKSANKNLTGFYAHRVHRALVALMAAEAKNFKAGLKKTTPKLCEWSFGNSEKTSLKISTEIGTVQLKGRIDRVDVNHTHKNFSVIDYKTGSLPQLSEIKSAQIVQLPLYMMATQAVLFPTYEPTGAFYYALKENDIKGFAIANSVDAKLLSKHSHLSLESWHELKEKIQEQVNKVVTNIFKGNFNPKPRDEALCNFCDYRTICGYYNATH